MLWQEEHPEVAVFEGYGAFKADVMAWLDSNFRKFLYRGVKHEIRLEEIAWGGVIKDGIPALTNPKHIGADQASYLVGDELVFGVEINGDARAYPFRMMDWHEMFNDVVGGIPFRWPIARFAAPAFCSTQRLLGALSRLYSAHRDSSSGRTN